MNIGVDFGNGESHTVIKIGDKEMSPAGFLYAMADEYHRRTEAFDRVCCRCVNKHGISVPDNAHELSLVNHNARRVRRQLFQLVAQAGFNESDWQKAIVKSADKNFFSPGFIDSVDIESLLANFSGKTGEEVKGPKVELRMEDLP